MPIKIGIPKEEQNPRRPIITVFAVGGAGGNAINNMISSKLEGAKFISANTDAQALENSLAETKIQLGNQITNGLGAGANPDIGSAAAEEAITEIMDAIEGSNIVFITAGMGGGTGTGAAPVVARAAKEKGILTIGVVTKPFNFEGIKRMEIAEEGITELAQYVDTLIVIPNQNLFKIADEKTTFSDAFKLADKVLYSGVQGITDLMMMPGLINLDFADIKTVMSEMGKAMMGAGEAEGENRAIKAAEAAISNPLLAHASMKGAQGVLINITGGNDLTLFEVDDAANRIREEIKNEDANIIFGSTFNEKLTGKIRVSVVATGIEPSHLLKVRIKKTIETDNIELEEETIMTLDEDDQNQITDFDNEEKRTLTSIMSSFMQKLTNAKNKKKLVDDSDDINQNDEDNLEMIDTEENEESDIDKSKYDVPAFLRKKEKLDH
ncbi:MAG: cell division protein FtsZ [Rickettsiales bacterium]|nr:cell division protein FtsZ [Rickettsiales bacterium]